MLDVLRRAVADRQELPGSPIAIELDDVTVEIDRATAAEARRRARATGLPHNAARTTFRDTLGSLLVQQGVERLHQNLEDPPELADILRELGDLPEIEPTGAAQLSAELRHELRDDLRSDLDFHAAVERLWPVLTPERLLAELFARRTAYLGRRTLARKPTFRAAPRRGLAWTVADAPLLDELAELLGPHPGRLAERTDSAYAAEVLNILESADRRVAGEDPDELRPTDFVTADVLAARQVPEHHERRRAGRRPGLAVQAPRHRRGAGSAMDWHVLLRRCPSGSVTAAATSPSAAPAGAHAWADVLARTSVPVDLPTPR
jgi:hypothetical protein